jgi:hypothetical protein
MNLQLPTERQLPEPEQMVDRILAEAPAGARRGRNRYGLYLGVAAAAAITVTASVVGISALRQDRPELGGAPHISASPQPADSASPTVGHSTPLHPTATQPTDTQAVGTQAVGTTVTFRDLAVTVRSAGAVQVNNVPVDEYTIVVTTCVRRLPPGSRAGRVELKEDSFSLRTGTRIITTDDPFGVRVPTPVTYPQQGSYAVGQCASGVIPFGVDHKVTVTSIDYADSFGDRASWTP